MDRTSNFTYDEPMRLGKLNGIVIPSVTEIVGEFLGHISGNAQAGIAVHLATELLDRGVLNWRTVADSIMPYVMGYEKFLSETGFKPKRIEERLFHPYLRFHGRFDREGTWNLSKGRQLIDLKKYPPPVQTGVQLAGYDLLLPTLKDPRGRWALELKDDATYRLHEYESGEDKDVFLSMLTIKNWRMNNNVRPIHFS